MQRELCNKITRILKIEEKVRSYIKSDTSAGVKSLNLCTTLFGITNTCPVWEVLTLNLGTVKGIEREKEEEIWYLEQQV